MLEKNSIKKMLRTRNITGNYYPMDENDPYFSTARPPHSLSHTDIDKVD